MRFCDRGGTTTTGTTTTKRAAPTSEEMKAAHAEDHAVECSCQSTANRDFAEGSRLAGPEPSAHTEAHALAWFPRSSVWRRGSRTPQQCARLFVSTTGSVTRVSSTGGVAPPQRATTPADPTLTPDWLYGPGASCGMYSAEHLFGARG